MKKKLLVTALMVAMLMSLTACSPSLEVVGKWRIVSVVTGDVTMDADDLAEYGIQDTGYIKLQRSGNCAINLLGDENKGTWKMSKNGKKITITYGKKTLTASYDGSKLTMTDVAGTEYTLEK